MVSFNSAAFKYSPNSKANRTNDNGPKTETNSQSNKLNSKEHQLKTWKPIGSTPIYPGGPARADYVTPEDRARQIKKHMQDVLKSLK